MLSNELLNTFVITKDLADVTLASDDGITLRAKKTFLLLDFKSLPKLNALTSQPSTFFVAMIIIYKIGLL